MKLDMTRVDGWADGPALCEPAVQLDKMKFSNVVRCDGCGTEMILFEATMPGYVALCTECESRPDCVPGVRCVTTPDCTMAAQHIGECNPNGKRCRCGAKSWEACDMTKGGEHER